MTKMETDTLLNELTATVLDGVRGRLPDVRDRETVTDSAARALRTLADRLTTPPPPARGTVPLYRAIAQSVAACLSCAQSGNDEWETRHRDRADKLVKDHMPSGSGIDCGTKLDWDRCTGGKMVFTLSFHHMNEHGYYDGWTDYTVTVRPDWNGVDIRIGGKDRNQIKDYLADVYHHALTDTSWQ